MKFLEQVKKYKNKVQARADRRAKKHAAQVTNVLRDYMIHHGGQVTICLTGKGLLVYQGEAKSLHRTKFGLGLPETSAEMQDVFLANYKQTLKNELKELYFEPCTDLGGEVAILDTRAVLAQC